MRILIVGGGIAGLSLAGFLKKNGLHPHLIEKAPHWKDIGFAVQLWEHGRRPLDKLGLYGHVTAGGHKINTATFVTNTGKRVTQLDFRHAMHVSHPVVAIERSRLHWLLRESTADIPKHLGRSIEHMVQDDSGVSVTFDNGKKATFDIVIGADGIHSKVRQAIFGDDFTHYYDWAVWMDWLPAVQTLKNDALAMVGHGKVFFIYPVTPTKYCVMFFLPSKHGTPENPRSRIAMLREQFAEFTGIVPVALSSIKNPQHMYHDDLSYINMSEWHRGRVGLIGDAEHALSPLSGMGCSMAIEDAYVLAELLKTAQPEKVPQVWEDFAKLRQPRIDTAKYESRLIWRWFSPQSAVVCNARNMIVPLVPQSYFSHTFRKMLATPLT